MDEERLEQKLQKYLQSEVQNAELPREWWDNAISRLGEQKYHSRWSWFIPKTRLAWALLPLVILLVGCTVYGATSGIKRLFEGWARDVEKQGLAQSLNLSQTIDGITVTLERAYADSNVVLIGYTVNQPDDQNFRLGGTLTTADGQSLDGLMGMIGAPDAERLGISNSATIFAYDASIITGTPTELNLTLKVGTIVFSGITDEATPVPGPFIFSFSVPFHAGKVIGVNETVEASGVPITLEQVVITPWATRVDFNFYPHYDGPSIVSLMLPSGNSEDMSMSKDMGTSLLLCYCNGDFTNESGEWTIKINDLGSPPTRIGPWVFHFKVP